MRAVVQREVGGPEVLEVAEVERPELLSGEVLVRVRAAGVNPVDVAVRAGWFPLLGEPPFTVGWDVSGVVEEAAPGARYRVGEEVYGMPFFPRAANAYAEYVAAPSRQLARKPASIDHAQAAALPLAALTAWQGLVDLAGVSEGQRVLVHRAAGGVGHFAVQIAKARGAYVIALASEPKHAFLREIGADEVVDYRTTDYTTVVEDVDIVFDSSSENVRALEVLKPGGFLVSIMEHRDRELAAAVEAAGRHFAGVSVEPDYAGLEAIAALVDEGRIRPHVTRAFPLAEAGRAHELVASGTVQGKVVLTVD
ncbi:NADP-dependent oxidoreductase [Kitasatospora sp. NPDC056446]|uniref:NADP-dependent oxidoreductase n=1 Tax=Kitasatospora sp. NPDC056446 TaxID=3345819 RepID=UPI00369F4135